MAAKVVAALLGTFGLAYVVDSAISDTKIFGGKTPGTISKEWWNETDKRTKAWPRTAGPPVVLNPLARQNWYISKDSE